VPFADEAGLCQRGIYTPDGVFQCDSWCVKVVRFQNGVNEQVHSGSNSSSSILRIVDARGFLYHHLGCQGNIKKLALCFAGGVDLLPWYSLWLTAKKLLPAELSHYIPEVV
jgi:hypothetical protein